jgi:hypothetical protein
VSRAYLPCPAAHPRLPLVPAGSGRFYPDLDAYVAAVRAAWNPGEGFWKPSGTGKYSGDCGGGQPRLSVSPYSRIPAPARTGMLVEGRVGWTCMPMVADEGPTVFFLLCTAGSALSALSPG